MTDDPYPGATTTDTRAGRVPDASAARLLDALQSRAGHALVIGDDAAGAEALFDRVDAQLVCQRRVRLFGAGLDAEAMIQALGADIHGPHRPRSSEAILSMAATEARAAGLPILVVVAGAEEAGAAALQRLAALVESGPDARAAVRLVLLGGPRLAAVVAQPEAEKLAARVLTTVRAPSKGAGRWVFPVPGSSEDSSWRDTAQWAVAGLVAVVGAILFFAPWAGRDAVVRTAMHVEPADAERTAPEAPTASAPEAFPRAEAPADAEARAPAPDAAAPAEPAPPTEDAASPEPPAGAAPSVVEPSSSAAPAVAEPPAAAPVTEAPRASSAPAPAARERRAPSIGQTLQVGAFRNTANARALSAKLSARFPDVRIVTLTRDGVRYHCVRLGGFADEYALAARADQLRAAGYAFLRAPE